jgi:hypothetical protein
MPVSTATQDWAKMCFASEGLTEADALVSSCALAVAKAQHALRDEGVGRDRRSRDFASWSEATLVPLRKAFQKTLETGDTSGRATYFARREALVQAWLVDESATHDDLLARLLTAERDLVDANYDARAA